MEALQSIGLITLAVLAYRYLWMPYATKKKEDAEEIERNIGILSFSQKDMSALFHPHTNYVEKKRDDDDFYSPTYGGWIKLYERTVYFSSNTEIANFKKKAADLYTQLINDENKKSQVKTIIEEQKQRDTEKNKQKEILYLGLRKHYLEYNDILKKLLPDSKIAMPRSEIIAFLEKELNKSTPEAEIIFNNLSHRDTGLLSMDKYNDYQGKYRYFGEINIKTKMEQF